MSNPIITFPLRRPVLTTVLYIIVIIIGLFSLWRLPIDLMPEITSPTITVMTSYGNAGPQEVEELITRVVESSLAGVQGIQEITSNSSEGRSRVRASFVWGTNLDEAMDDIRDRLDRILGRLPDDAERPTIRKFDVSASPIMIIGVSSELDPADVRQLIEDQIQYRLERVDGVASVDLWGGSRKEVQVTLRASALKALNISPDMIVNAIRQENRNIPAGSVEQGYREVIVRTLAEYNTIEDLRNTVVALRDGVPVTIGDVASITDGLQEITSIVRINGEPGFRLTISKQSGVNTVAVAGGVKKEIDRINKDFPQIKIVPLSDTSKFIQQAIASMGNSLILGGIIAIVILLLFLRNLSSTFIIATVIPVSVIATFSLIYFGGLTLNMMTFGGLALGIGMLVDNAIVVLDNIFHYREKGGEPKECAIQGASEVTSAVISSTLTTLVVFFPVIFIRGISGIMFRQLAYVVSFALACSLIAALTLIPVLTSRFLKISRSNRTTTFFPKLFDQSEKWYRSLEESYGKVIDWALGHRLAVIIGSLVLLIVSIVMIPVIGQELMPSTDEGEVRVDCELEVGTRMELTDSVMQKIEAIVTREVPEATYILTNVGNGNNGDIVISLVPKNKRKRSTSEIAEGLRRTIVNIPGATVRIREGRGMFSFRMGQSGAQSVDIELRGHDLATGQQLATALSEKVKEIPGITDVRISREAGIPEYVLRINRKKAADLGLTASQIGTAIRTAMGGTQVTSIRRSGKEYAIIVRLEEAQTRTISRLSDLTVINKSGAAIPIQSVTQVSEATGPVQIERRDRERIINVNTRYSGRDLSSLVTEIRNVINTMSIPSDFAVIVRGDYEEQQKAQRELLIGLAMAVLLIYLVMAGQFESFKDPFIILFAIPMALIGVVLVLFLTATPFSMQAYIGCIVLAGIVVNNAIVLVDYMNRLRREKGFELKEAVKEAGVRRLRPILMTVFTTALGLLPLALALGEGGETQAPMARVVIGGLLSSSFITLLLIPVIYSLVEERHENRKARKQKAETILPQGTALLLVFAFFSLSFVTRSHAVSPDTLKFSLQDVLQKAVQHNPLVQIERIDIDVAERSLKESYYRFEPSLSATLEQNRVIESGYSTAPEYQGTVQLSGVLPSGTGLSVKSTVSPNSRSAVPGNHFQRELGLTVTQSLLANGGLGANLVIVRKASIDLDMCQEELIVYAQRLLADVERTYWDLYLADQEAAIHQKALDLANRLLYESQERLNVGKIAPLDLVTVRAEVATREKNLINAQAGYIQKKYRLSYLLNDSIPLWDIPLVILDRPSSPKTPDSLHYHLDAARKFRTDLRLARHQLDKGELDVVQTRNGLLPKLDAFITLSGTAYAESFSKTINDAEYNSTGMSAGLSLSLPLTNGAARQRYQKALLSKKQQNVSIENLQKLMELDVRSAWTEVNRSISQITAARTARELQEEKHVAEQARLAAGKSTEYLVLQAQRDLVTSQLDEARSEVGYCNAVTDLFLKDGTLLERRGVQSIVSR